MESLRRWQMTKKTGSVLREGHVLAEDGAHRRAGRLEALGVTVGIAREGTGHEGVSRLERDLERETHACLVGEVETRHHGVDRGTREHAVARRGLPGAQVQPVA